MKWNNRNLVPPGKYNTAPKKPEFDYNKALKPYGEGNRGKVWIPVQQIIMNVPETSSVPVSPTPTPSITATATLTPTPTPTDSRACRTYTILGSCFASTAFSWTNCDGTSGTQTLYCSSQNICAKQGSVSQSGGLGTITDIGTCPLPTPTPTATSTLTPTLTPTNTTTPTPTSSPIESMVLMEDSGSILMEGTGSVLMEIQ